MGGYDPEAGRNAHDADKPTLIPVPSLLRSLLSDHLDPGYAAAAQAKAAGPTSNLVAGVGVADHRRAGDRRGVRRRGRAGTLDGTGCARVPTGARRQRAIGGDRHQRNHRPPQCVGGPGGRRAAQAASKVTRVASSCSGNLDEANFAAAATPVIGPGLTITVTDPGMSEDLSDVSKQRVAGSQQVILDRDLQLVVNSLWVSGAEAISVGGVRIGPNVTIRQAGGGILVDNQPISSPYAILAVGPPHAMQDVFDRSPGLQRLRLLETSYGVGVSVSAGDGLALPAGSVRDIKFAKQIG